MDGGEREVGEVGLGGEFVGNVCGAGADEVGVDGEGLGVGGCADAYGEDFGAETVSE